MRRRRTYVPLRIDFTPFVSIALLLIIFFFWTKLAAKPNVMRAYLPERFCYWGAGLVPDANILLLKNNRIGFLTYSADGTEAELVETGFSANGLKKKLAGIMSNHDYGAVVMVTPTKESTYRNLVDILDELRVAGRIWYQLNTSLTPEEQALLRHYDHYKISQPTQTRLLIRK
ncbi:biopolymer transporter ExbD [Spirosoma flavus]